MKKRLVAILASLITVIGTLVAVPVTHASAAVGEPAYVVYDYIGCMGGYFNVTAQYVNNDIVEQSLGLMLDGVMVDGPYIVTPGTQIQGGRFIKEWKPKISAASELSLVRNGEVFGSPILVDIMDCMMPFGPSWGDTVSPKITGKCSPGEKVRVSSGKWSKPNLNFGYRWYYGRKDAGGAWFYNQYTAKPGSWIHDIIPNAYGRSFKIPKSFKKGYVLTMRLVAGTGDIPVFDRFISCVLK